jgi:hypothetical protein
VELGHTMPSAMSPEIQAEVLRVFEQAVAALGIRLGAAKGDIKYCPSRGKAMVGEIAARLSGGYMSGWTYPYASGIDVTREALLLCVGEGFGPAPADRGWVSAERAFISIPGVVAAVEGYAEAERKPYVKQLFLRAAKGDRVVFPANNVEKCGNVISQGPSREAAVEAAESAARCIRIRLAPDDPDTEAYLRGEWRTEGSSWPPFAFRVEGEAARELAAMPEYVSAEGSSAASSFRLAESVKGRDWSGRSFAESASQALAVAAENRDCSASRQETSVIPAGRFWRALARGGAQAAIYILDTEAARREAAR